MARSRNIKPGFFVNDLLAEIDPLGRLLFIGLWTIADKEGRLEDRPKRIQASCLPYDQANVDSYLNQLQEKGFIRRYSVEQKMYIQIINWRRHQNPHHKETGSEIPEPSKKDIKNQEDIHAQAMLGSSIPNKPGTSLEQTLLIPDSLNLIPDSLQSDSLQKSSENSDEISRPDRVRIPYQKIIDAFHEILPELPKTEKLTEKRKRYIKNLWADDLPNLKNWQNYFKFVSQSDFLMGRSTTGRPFKATLEWITKPENFIKIYEKNYHG